MALRGALSLALTAVRSFLAADMACFCASITHLCYFGGKRSIRFEARGSELTRFDCGSNSACRLVGVRAVAEAAVLCEFFDIGKCSAESLVGIPYPKSPHTGHIDDGASIGYVNHHTVHSRMATFPVVFPNLGRILNDLTSEIVYEGRFADAALSDEDSRCVGRNKRTHVGNRCRVVG